jgi:hypothetical protein
MSSSNPVRNPKVLSLIPTDPEDLKDELSTGHFAIFT